MQYEVISHIMSGGDSIVLMPTGGGKSLCYQIPALLSDGCCVVVSPLLALMKDQVDALIANGVPAASINSMQTEAQNRDVLDCALAGRIKLLYISPERLLGDLDNWSKHIKSVCSLSTKPTVFRNGGTISDPNTLNFRC